MKFNVIFRSAATGAEVASEHSSLEEARAAAEEIEIGQEVTFDGKVVGVVEGVWVEDEEGNGW